MHNSASSTLSILRHQTDVRNCTSITMYLLNKVWWSFGDKVLDLKLRWCPGQLSSCPVSRGFFLASLRMYEVICFSCISCLLVHFVPSRNLCHEPLTMCMILIKLPWRLWNKSHLTRYRSLVCLPLFYLERNYEVSLSFRMEHIAFGRSGVRDSIIQFLSF